MAESEQNTVERDNLDSNIESVRSLVDSGLCLEQRTTEAILGELARLSYNQNKLQSLLESQMRDFEAPRVNQTDEPQGPPRSHSTPRPRQTIRVTEPPSSEASAATTICQPTQTVPLSEVIHTVPVYDGKNMPVLQFARACRRARTMIPDHGEPHLVRLLRSKLVGIAYLAVEDEMH
ncbi:hypothetical protein KPH14_000713, partial [Odynerus spinipes]